MNIFTFKESLIIKNYKRNNINNIFDITILCNFFGYFNYWHSNENCMDFDSLSHSIENYGDYPNNINQREE